MRRIVLTAAVPLLLAGCINITTELQPPDAAVKPILYGEDCTPIVLGIGIGTNTIDTARQFGEPREETRSFLGPPREASAAQTIRRIRRIRLTDYGFLNLVGARCLEVIGEP